MAKPCSSTVIDMHRLSRCSTTIANVFNAMHTTLSSPQATTFCPKSNMVNVWSLPAKQVIDIGLDTFSVDIGV